MTRCARPVRPLLLALGAATSLVACSDGLAPTDPAARGAVIAAQPNKPKGPLPKLRTLDLSSTIFTIDGAELPYSVTIQNSGPPRSSIVVRSEIVQGPAARDAGSSSASCPTTDGNLPTGACTMQLGASASNLAPGTGTLAAGPAMLVLRLVQADGVSPEVVLDTRSTAISLLAAGSTAPSIANLTMSATTLVIGGTSVPYDVTIANPGPPLSGIFVQGEMLQNGNTAGASGFSVHCPPLQVVGDLPTGSCTMTLTTSASNITVFPSPLVPGPAVFRLTLYNGASDVLDTETVAVTLVSGSPTITSLTMSTTTLVIGGASVSYDVTVTNPGAPLSGIFVQGEMLQNGNTAGAAGFNVQCPPQLTSGELPTGSCAMTLNTLASNILVFPSPLVPGPAVFRLTLYDAASNALDTETVAVTLVSGEPTITSVVFADPNNVLISLTQSAPYTVTIENPGLLLTGVGIQGEIFQDQGNGVIARRGAGGFPVECSPAVFGILPTGTCTMPTAATVNNTTGGDGDLREGPATFVLTLDKDGVVIGTKSVPITLRGQLF